MGYIDIEWWHKETDPVDLDVGLADAIRQRIQRAPALRRSRAHRRSRAGGRALRLRLHRCRVLCAHAHFRWSGAVRLALKWRGNAWAGSSRTALAEPQPRPCRSAPSGLQQPQSRLHLNGIERRGYAARVGARRVCAGQEKLLNGATDGATPETRPYRARMSAGSEPDREAMIEHVIGRRVVPALQPAMRDLARFGGARSRSIWSAHWNRSTKDLRITP